MYKRKNGSETALEKSVAKSIAEERRREQQSLGFGGARYRANNDVEKDGDERIHVIVRDVKPKFLRGKSLSGESLKIVYPVKDPTSDIAILSHKGSAIVRYRREQREKVESVRHLQVAGSNLGNILGLKKDDGDLDDAVEEDALDTATPLGKEAPIELPEKISLAQQRRSLPIFAVKSRLMQAIRENQIVVIVGETGSGKTTQITQYLLENGYGASGMIACTQPRRVAATSVARRVSEEQNTRIGDLVGYAVRFDDCTSAKTKIRYMTDGILVRESLHDAMLERYSCIMLDEAHERGLQTDVLMGLLKRLVSRSRKDLKVIIASATMDAAKFAEFFGNVPVFNIPGRTFPVDVLYTRSPAEDYVEAAIKQVLTIHMSNNAGDILVFLTGQEDIETACELLKDRVDQLEVSKPLYVYPIYSQLPQNLQDRVFNAVPKNARKVIIATNIAETSLTLDGIVYVIDSGYCKLKVYNPKIGMDVLSMFPVSQANANQRTGRAGRVQAGTCFRLYTENCYRDELLRSSVPEIQRTNLSNIVLLLKSLKVARVEDFDFMDMPPPDNILNSMHQLWTLGALSSSGDLTPLGRKMVEFPLEPSLSKMLLVAAETGCAFEMITIVAMLSVPNVFYRPKERAGESDSKREKFFVPESDHLTLLHVYNQYRTNGFRDSWCVDHFLLPKALRRVKQVREQLLEIMDAQKLPVVSCGTDWDVIRKCICSAYFHNACRIKALGEYVNLRIGTTCCVHPTSALFGLGYTADYVVYNDLVMTNRPYMQCVTAVEPVWLANFGPMFFAIRGQEFVNLASCSSDEESQKKSVANEKPFETPKASVAGKFKRKKLLLPQSKDFKKLAGKANLCNLSFED